MRTLSIFRRCLSAAILILGHSVFCPLLLTAQKKAKAAPPPPPVVVDKSGKVVYAAGERGDKVVDFSFAGYMAGASAIPAVPVKVVVPMRTGDAGLRIQAALDYVAGLPLNAQGLRGAVLLEKGIYEVGGSLLLRASGVVLRGSGMGEDGTILVATGTDRRTLIRVMGVNDRVAGAAVAITDAYVPVGSAEVSVGNAGVFHAGDQVTISRPCTNAWVDRLGVESFGGGISALGWKEGQRVVQWDRTVVGVEQGRVRLDAPLTTSLDTAYGGGTINTYKWPGRIRQTGVENLRLQSVYDAANPKDEAHSWMAVTMENVEDSWVRQVVAGHFAGSAVAVLETGRRITVEDCKSLAPVSEIGGQRRNSFFTMGQQCLFQRLYSEFGYHDFSTGFCAAGPNAFVQCQSYYSFGFSGAQDSWASGLLFDVVNIDGQPLSYANRGQDGQGAGWTAANSMLWNCTAARIDCPRPPGAQNYSFGSWAQFTGDGYWHESNGTVQPRSLYYAQLASRLGESVMPQAAILPMETEASSSPTVAQAAELIAQSSEPRVQMTAWIDQAAKRVPIDVMNTGAPTIDKVGVRAPALLVRAAPMRVVNGWLVRGATVLSGRRHYEPWWMGTPRPYGVKEAKPAITRYVPGRTGVGLTDDLDSLAADMETKHIVAMDHNYGLWYERRRDDHERIRRMDGDVWAPFYELPFARSGRDTAWDGLSKYDLTKYNPWYWSRLRRFAELADEKGLVLIHQNYFQHNIIEAGAHYADFPWRPANNINQTGFPEPPPYAGDKRIFMAQFFYDTTHAVRRVLHRAFIRQCLDNFSNNSGVIQLIGAEFTGPLHFVEFWVDNIREWETEKGRRETIGLSVTKDVQDAILADPVRAATIDLIDIRYWYYQQDGKLYAPLGGQSLAPRQHERLLKPRRSSFEQVCRSVREYRLRYPDKAVMYSADGDDSFGWAVFMGGGSLANIPSGVGKAFLTAAAGMQPVREMVLEGANGAIYYKERGSAAIDMSKYTGKYKVHRIDPVTGKMEDGKLSDINGTVSGAVVFWIER